MAKSAASRGRNATRPRDIPTQGWRDILLRTKQAMVDDHVSVVAAGVAFFALLALFPAITAVISVTALVLDPAQIEAQMEELAGVLPEDAASIIQGQAQDVASGAETGLGLAAIFGVLLALYGASKGMKSLIEGMNIAYDEPESRSFIKYNAVALALTLFLIFGFLVAIGAIIVLPIVVGWIGLPDGITALVDYARWPILALLVMLGLAVIYRFGPSREDATWRWVSPGAVVATILWVLASIGFEIYVRNFGNYNETYGTLGGVIVLLTWLWVSALIVLLGAELNAEIEHQTQRDTTSGKPQPRGERGAKMADNVGRSP
jgi:membrane protein